MGSSEPQQYGSVLPDAVEDHDAAQVSAQLNCGQKLLLRLQLIAALCVATFAGVTARIHLAMLAKWTGFPEFPSLYAQLFGSAILGILSAHKHDLLESHKTCYAAVATGLCGSITTFSSWNAEAAFSLLQVNRTSLTLLRAPDDVSRVVTFITILLLGLAAPVAALHFGKSVGACLPLKDMFNKGSCKSSTAANTAAVSVVWALSTGAVVAVCLVYNKLDFLFSLILGCGH